MPPIESSNYGARTSLLKHTEKEVRQAIREVTTGMLRPPIANLGVKGIRTASERILKWPEIMKTTAWEQLQSIVVRSSRGKG